MNKEQKELIRKLNLKSVVECKEECKYNNAGKLTLCKYKDGTTEEWHYNKAGQLTLRKYSDGTTAEWHYNKAGKLTLRKDTNNIYWIDEKPYRKEETQ